MYNSREERSRYLFKCEIKQRENKLKNIEDAINLFYAPLSFFFAIQAIDLNAQVRSQKIIEINCNKHLAEPRVRALFESYMQGNKEPKLSELIKRDIESLQKQYIELKKELTEE